MKNLLIILGLILFSQNVFAVEKIYLQEQTPYNAIRPYSYNSRINPYYSPYRYRKTNYNDAKRLQRIQRIRHLNRIRNNFISLFNTNNQGSLTGYSTPINSNVFTQMNLDPWETKYSHKSPNCTTELFSSPTTTNTYYRSSGVKIQDDGRISNKTGVTIIYD